MQERKEAGIIIGNVTDKAHVQGRIGRSLVAGFDAALLRAAQRATFSSIHEVGCGEGRISRLLFGALGVPVRATDFSTIITRENLSRGDRGIGYVNRSIYELDPEQDSADLIICCEVLEHLENPEAGLAQLARLRASSYVLSVPREPLWRTLNVLRGKYVSQLGNTPGHLNHWSKRTFSRLLQRHGFIIHEWLNPFPWLMVVGRFKGG
jgi:2-polyprenyl-3-methyl-5-hydroxy-6-metoxy-1,4-benzoquinol methylase